MARHILTALMALMLSACTTGAETTGTTAEPTITTAESTTTTVAAYGPALEAPVALAEAFMSHLQHGDCQAAVDISITWAWNVAPTRDQALVNCESLLSRTPEISGFRTTEVYLGADNLPLLGGPDVMVVFDVTYATGVSAVWSASLAADPWVVVGISWS